MLPSLLSLNQLSFRYHGNRADTLKELNCTIKEGDFLLLQGKSGGGKSTLLKLICRLLENHIGTILYKGEDIKTVPPTLLRRKLNYLPQLPVLLFGTVEENLALPFSLHSATGEKFNRNEAERLLDAFLLPLKLSDTIAKCSVGEKQRICLIRSLLLQPDILLLDEPTASLDALSAKALLATLFRINREEKRTILLVSHQQVSPPDGHLLTYYHLKDGELKEGKGE